jgi:hypothetical protein
MTAGTSQTTQSFRWDQIFHRRNAQSITGNAVAWNATWDSNKDITVHQVTWLYLVVHITSTMEDHQKLFTFICTESCWSYGERNYKIHSANGEHKFSASLIEVGAVRGYSLDGWGLILSRGKRFFSILQLPDWLWGPPNLLSNDYQGHFPQR